MNNNNNLFKYIFAVVVAILVIYTMYIILHNKSEVTNTSLDQTSTLTNIQTDLRFAIAEMDTINPLISNNRNVQEITKIIYEPLVTLNENYKMEYCLADEIARTDDLNYVIKLKKGILWEDRSSFTAEDVVYTIELIKNGGFNSIYSSNLREVVEASVVDETTLNITLSQSVPFFEYNLTFPIMCKKHYEEEDFALSEKVPIGTGMFKISEISSNVIKLVQNEYYWNAERKPMATEISINLYSSIGEVYTAFKNGEIDILEVKSANIEDYIGTLGYNKIEYKSRDYDFLTINTENEILSEPAVRKALNLAIDKNNIVGTCLGKGYIASNFSLDMGFWLYTKDLNTGVDTEKAAQTLIDAGWERTSSGWQKREETGTKRLTFSITVSTDNESRVKVVETIKEQLESFGVPVSIRYLSGNNYVDAINNKNYEVAITGIRLGYSPNLFTFFGNGNIANYYNEEVAEIMQVVSNTNEENVLYEKHGRLYDIYLEEAPYIGLYRNTEMVVYNQSLVGNIKANAFNIYHNIEKWYRQ